MRSVLDTPLEAPPGVERTIPAVADQPTHRDLPLGRRPSDLRVDERVVESGSGGVLHRGRVEHAVGPRPIDRAEAHGTRLAGRINIAPFELKGAHAGARAAHRDDLRMGGRIVTARHEIRALADD